MKPVNQRAAVAFSRRGMILSSAALLAALLPGSDRKLLAAQHDTPATGANNMQGGVPSLAGKTVLITGSTDGLGRVVALKLASAGAHVIVHGRSKDGYELRFAVNYLSGFLLTRLLLPTIVNSTPARIVNVASLGQRPIDFDDVMLERNYDGGGAYAQSKLAQIMFTVDLADELKGRKVTANSLHPATYMDTAMVRDAGIQPRSTVEEGADAVVFVATSPQLDGKSGLFFNGKQEMRANAQAYDAAARAKLKALSEKLTQGRV